MLTVDEALERVERHARALVPRRVALGEASGLVLAEDVASDIDSPPHDKAMMDGYAVRSADRQAQRQVLEEIAAGAVPRSPVTPGGCSRIMTGAPLPAGADAVVPVEQTEMVDESMVRLAQVDPQPGQHVMRRGTAMRVGDRVLAKGAVLRPIEIAILAEVGRWEVKAYPRARVAVLPTGNELVDVDELPAPGQIRNSNGPMLVSAAREAGAEAIELAVARDDREQLTGLVREGLAADVLLLSGGVSAGKFDLVPAVLAELGVTEVFHKVALRPGKPLWFGVREANDRRTLVFGLPGNPVSSFVCFELFVRPALRALGNLGFAGLPKVVARLSHDHHHRGERAACLPAEVEHYEDGTSEVTILPWHGSADLATVAQANGLARLPAQSRQFERGERIEVLLI